MSNAIALYVKCTLAKLFSLAPLILFSASLVLLFCIVGAVDGGADTTTMLLCVPVLGVMAWAGRRLK